MGTITTALAAISEVSSLTKEFWHYLKGGKTRDQETTQDEADKWVQEFSKALESGDIEHCNFALDRLRLLRDKAVARKSG